MRSRAGSWGDIWTPHLSAYLYLALPLKSVAFTLIWLLYGECSVSHLGICVLFLTAFYFYLDWGSFWGGKFQSDKDDCIKGEAIIIARWPLSLHDCV